MIGVPFCLAVIWLDSERRVVDRRIARPWQIALVPKKAAQYIIECHPQRIEEFSEGHAFEFLEG